MSTWKRTKSTQDLSAGVALVFIPKAGDEQGAQPLMPAVNMVDLQMVEPINAKEPKLV